MAASIEIAEIGEFENDQYKCALCLHFLKEPVLTACGHKYCETCIKSRLKESKSCPLCKKVLKKFDIFTDNHTKRLITDIKLVCTNINRGCQEQLSPYELEKHLKNCSFANAEIIYGNELSLLPMPTSFSSTEEAIKEILQHLNNMRQIYERIFRDINHRFEIQNQDITKLRNCFQQLQLDQEARPSAPNQLLEQMEEKLNNVMRQQRRLLTNPSIITYNKSEAYVWTIEGVYSKLLANTVKALDFNSPIFYMKGPDLTWNLKLCVCLIKTSSFGEFYIYPFVKHLGYHNLDQYSDTTFQAQIIITFVHPSLDSKRNWVYIYNHYGGTLSNYLANKYNNIYSYFFQGSQTTLKVDDIVNNGFVTDDDQLIVKVEVLTF